MSSNLNQSSCSFTSFLTQHRLTVPFLWNTLTQPSWKCDHFYPSVCKTNPSILTHFWNTPPVFRAIYKHKHDYLEFPIPGATDNIQTQVCLFTNKLGKIWELDSKWRYLSLIEDKLSIGSSLASHWGEGNIILQKHIIPALNVHNRLKFSSYRKISSQHRLDTNP